MDRLEQVQERAMKMIVGLQHLTLGGKVRAEAVPPGENTGGLIKACDERE